MMYNVSRSQWPPGLRRRSAVARLLRSWVRIPPRAWIFVCCVCCVLLGRGLCDGLITRLEESCRMWCVVVCDLETSRMRRPWPALGRSSTAKKKYIYIYTHTHTHTQNVKGPRYFSRYSDSLRAGRSGDRIPVGASFSAPVQTRPWGPPSLLHNGYRVFPEGKEAGAWSWPPIHI